MSAQQIEQHTEKWIKTLIIPYKICPFAQAVVEKQRLHYYVDYSMGVETALMGLVEECQRLDSDESIETTLLIYADLYADFDDFLDYLELANTLLETQGYVGVYQLASFHPDYCFEGADETDAANYTNRSPYPMLHLLRESSLEQALKDYPNPESIPEHNLKLTRKLGLAKMQTLLAACTVR